VTDVVLDSSVVVAWALPDEHLHPAAMRVMDQFGSGGLEPFVAGHFAFEIRNGLVRAARAGRVAWSAIPDWIVAIDALDATIVPLMADDEVILGLAQQHGLTWGDAHWVYTAARLDLPLLTADLRLARAVPDEVAIVVYLGDEEAA
jgi:predicted nucleic acid-binding protein